MKALILAAGYATRLYPLTKEYPKSLLKVGRRPIVDHIIGKLDEVTAIEEIIVITNSKFIAQFKKWLTGCKSKKPVTLVNDLTCNHQDRRGAIGDIDFVIDKKRIKDDLLVIGGDNIFDGNLKRFLSLAKANSPHVAIGVFDLKDKAKANRYGVIKIDSNSKIIDFKEKPNNPSSALVAMCLYYFPKEKLKLIKTYMNSKKCNCDATGFYIDWLRKKDAVHGFVFRGRWFDIGDHHFYNEAKQQFAKN